ncbi:MAG TPA: hypothetical protein EYO80_05490, partial [Candidatus Marinimicrobia bacterium]|nr:hypothetical protein [Candidatus Neomarinimicrobiota bacterium]
MKNSLLLIITLMIFGCENNTADQNERLIENIVNDIRIGWENGDGTAFYKHFLDWDGARYFEGNFAWAVVDTEIKLTT